jgi:preprotein translocase subunit SecE
MNTKTETSNTQSTADVAKWIAAVVLLVVGLVGFYYFDQTPLIVRVIALLALGGVAVFLALQTAKGQSAWDFTQSAQLEMRKVVWPTKQETLQTTGIVVLMALVMAIMIWIIDSLLFMLVKFLTT